MQINLLDIDIKPDMNIPSQLKKIFEEAGEVAEAVALGDSVNTIREALDTMQTCCTLINMVVAEDKINLDRLVWEHNDKLVRKGYLTEPSHFTDSPYLE